MNKDNGPQPSLSFKETKILLDPSSRKKIFHPRLSASEFFCLFFFKCTTRKEMVLVYFSSQHAVICKHRKDVPSFARC